MSTIRRVQILGPQGPILAQLPEAEARRYAADLGLLADAASATATELFAKELAAQSEGERARWQEARRSAEGLAQNIERAILLGQIAIIPTSEDLGLWRSK